MPEANARQRRQRAAAQRRTPDTPLGP